MRKSLLYNWWLSGSTEAFPEALKSLFSVLWLGNISSNTMIDESGNANDITITSKDFVTDYIPPTSTATFALANSAPLKVDDNFDGAWYTDAGAVKQVPVSHFINNDYTRTLVKYSNSAPYNVEWIGLLDDAATPTTDQWNQLHELFQLNPYWSGVFNINGVVKDNRALEGQGYKGWISYVDFLSLTNPTTTVKASINKTFLEINSNDSTLWDLMDAVWCHMLNDSALVTGAGTVSMKRPSLDRMTFPVAPTYTASGFLGNASTQYALTNYNATQHAQNYSQNSACFGVFKYAAGAGINGIFGHPSFTGTNTMQNSSTSANRINGGGNSTAADFSGTGYRALNRSGSASVQGYRGTTQTTGTGASGALTNEDFSVLRNAFGYSDAGISWTFIGGSLTQAQHGILNTAFTNHKTRLGL